ncbi:MAG: cytochrome c oxidase assembly protein [Pseudomonadota bacterium]
MSQAQHSSPQKKQLGWLVMSVVGMFAFAVFAMPPIYEAFCELTGLNGKPSLANAVNKPDEVLDRTVTLEFVTSVDAGLPWTFRGNLKSIDVHPGQIQRISFHVENTADHAVTGRAIPSIAPAVGTAFVKKTQCFCFEQQTLNAGQSVDMPVILYIDPALPKNIKTITLAYRFYRQPDVEQKI